MALLIVVVALTLVVGRHSVAPPTVVPEAPAGQAIAPADSAQISDLLYAAQRTEQGGAFFRNHASDISAWLAPGGMRIATADGEVSLSLAALGRSGSISAVSASAAPALEGITATLAHSAGGLTLSEWWVNRPSGLEQGFSLGERPAGEGALRLQISVGGSLAPVLAAPDTVAFAGSELTYGGLLAWDATGRDVATRFELDGSELSIIVDDAAAVYPLTIDPTFSQQAYLKASNTGADDEFGDSVAISGDTIVVGAVAEDSNATGIGGNGANNDSENSGAAYVFVRSGTIWTQQAYLKASNTDADDEFGFSVAIDGNTIVVAAHFEDSDANVVNGRQANNTAVDSGAAYVFTRTGTTWSQQAYLKTSNTGAGDRLGYSVAISGDTIVVGARNEDSNATGIGGNGANNDSENSGAAYVFMRSGTIWTQQAYLKASNTDADDHFGYAIAISGDTIVVGARREDSNATVVGGDEANDLATRAGAAYVFVRSATTWSQQAYLKASNTDAGDRFGWSVAISGDTIVVGALFEDSDANVVNGRGANNTATDSGAAYVFTRSGTSWSQQAYLKPSNTGISDFFGTSVAISGDTIVVGARLEASNATGVGGDAANDSASASGAAYVFVPWGISWVQQAYLKASNTQEGDNFGTSVAISGDTLVVGAHREASDATGVDGNGANNSASDSGAAYVIYDSDCLAPPFSDVAINHPFCDEIKWMKANGISTGFGDGTYRPAIDVTRQAMSAFMARLAGATLTDCLEPPFSDVPITHPFCEEIKWMKGSGVSTGFGDGTYRPAIDVTRQAMSAFMTRVAGVLPVNCTTPPFPDVPTDHPFCREINWMKNNDISTGFNDGTYRPGIDVTRQAMSAFMFRVSLLLD